MAQGQMGRGEDGQVWKDGTVSDEQQGREVFDVAKVHGVTEAMSKAMMLCRCSPSEAVSVTTTLMLNCMLGVIKYRDSIDAADRDLYAQDIRATLLDTIAVMQGMAEHTGDPAAAEAVLMAGAKRSRERVGMDIPDTASDLAHLPTEGKAH